MKFEPAAGTIASALIGAGLLAYGAYQRSCLRKSQNWPQTQGTIIDSAIGKDTSPDSNRHVVLVKYEYTVDGRRYSGTRIAFDQRTYLRKKTAEAQLGRFPVSSSVPVYFDPTKPSDAVLERTSLDIPILLISGAGLLVLAIVIVLFGAN